LVTQWRRVAALTSEARRRQVVSQPKQHNNHHKHDAKGEPLHKAAFFEHVVCVNSIWRASLVASLVRPPMLDHFDAHSLHWPQWQMGQFYRENIDATLLFVGTRNPSSPRRQHRAIRA
jgi:hypothetical protein